MITQSFFPTEIIFMGFLYSWCLTALETIYLVIMIHLLEDTTNICFTTTTHIEFKFILIILEIITDAIGARY